MEKKGQQRHKEQGVVINRKGWGDRWEIREKNRKVKGNVGEGTIKKTRKRRHKQKRDTQTRKVKKTGGGIMGDDERMRRGMKGKEGEEFER